MKLKEEFINGEDSLFHIKTVFDAEPSMDSAKLARDMNPGGKVGDSVHVGRVPGWLISQWLREAGVRWDEIEKRDEVIKKKMMSGDYSAFRNWEGNY